MNYKGFEIEKASGEQVFVLQADGSKKMYGSLSCAHYAIDQGFEEQTEAFTKNVQGFLKLFVPKEGRIYYNDVDHKGEVLTLDGDPEEKQSMYILDSECGVVEEFKYEDQDDKYFIFDLA